MELRLPPPHDHGDDDMDGFHDSVDALASTNIPAARPTALFKAATATAVAGGGGAGSAAFLGTVPDLAHTAAVANEDKTTALVLTCSVMLSIALVLRLCALRMQRSKHKARRVCHGRVHVKTMVHALDVSVYVVLWYAISIGMTLFNKWFLRVWADGGYPFSTTMTCLNMFIKCLLSRVVNVCSSRHSGDSTAISRALSNRTYWRLAVPIGLCTALDIMLSNLSFFYITVTFYTIVKSGGNVWNLLFSIWLGHQRPSSALFLVILLISSGIALASYGSTHFVLRGFVLVLAASVIGTLRWVLTQSLLKAMDDTNTTTNRIVAVVYCISPASAFGLLPIALVTEGRELVQSKFLREPHWLVASMGFIFVSGCLAFVLIFVEILLVKKTSALSLGIAGSFKDVTQVLLAVLIFRDHLVALNVCGLVVATSGMLLYTFLKHAPPSLSQLEETPSKYTRVSTHDESQPEGEDSDESSNRSSRPDDRDDDNRDDGANNKLQEPVHAIHVIQLDAQRRPLAPVHPSTSNHNKRDDHAHAMCVRRERKESFNSDSNSK